MIYANYPEKNSVFYMLMMWSSYALSVHVPAWDRMFKCSPRSASSSVSYRTIIVQSLGWLLGIKRIHISINMHLLVKNLGLLWRSFPLSMASDGPSSISSSRDDTLRKQSISRLQHSQTSKFASCGQLLFEVPRKAGTIPWRFRFGLGPKLMERWSCWPPRARLSWSSDFGSFSSPKGLPNGCLAWI